jgi:hypothetical protein
MHLPKKETGREGPASFILSISRLNNAEFTLKDLVDADIGSVRRIPDPQIVSGDATLHSFDAVDDAR